MKGLLKGLKYMSQIFDNEKEPEFEIGHPTDVKHVAHIGWDGPSASSPSWLNEFKTTSESSMGILNSADINNPTTQSTARDITEMQNSLGALLDSPTRHSGSKTKQSKRHQSSNGSVGSPTRDSTGNTKPRRYKNSPSSDSSNRPRRHQNQNSNPGSDLPSQDLPPMLKQSRPKKSKDSSHNGSIRSNHQDPHNDSNFGSGQIPEKNESCPSSILEGFQKRNECDEISRGIHAL